MISKHHNYTFDAVAPGGVPYAAGDRYYSQDLFRDMMYLMDRMGLVMKDLLTQIPILFSGGVVTKGTGTTLNITAGFGYAAHSIQTVLNYSGIPPTTQNEDIDAIRVAWTAQTDLAIPSYVPGSTNYVKVRYSETNGSTRTRAKKAGSYNYDQAPSFTFVVDIVAPTIYDLCLATFTNIAGTITPYVAHKQGTSIAGGVPIGAIIAWLPGYFTDGINGGYTPVSITLSSNFKECDGTAPNDPESLIYNTALKYLPNLTDDRFLMGDVAGSAGGIGGSNTQTHTIPAHYHGMGTGATLNITASGSHYHTIQLTNVSYQPGSSSFSAPSGPATPYNTSSDTHTHDAGNFSGVIGLVTGGVNGNAEMTSGSSNNRPVYLSCRFIQRIK